jgi:hypothetical protein
MLTRLGEVTFQVPQVRFGDFYIRLEKPIPAYGWSRPFLPNSTQNNAQPSANIRPESVVVESETFPVGYWA